jgi:hypothetical protein
METKHQATGGGLDPVPGNAKADLVDEESVVRDLAGRNPRY